MNRINSRVLAAIIIPAFALFISCRSDTPANKTDVGTEASPDAMSTDAAAGVQVGKKPEEIIAELVKLKKAHEKLEEKRAALQKQYDAIPTEVKQNAVNCDQLEAELEGHYERIKETINKLEQHTVKLQSPIQEQASETALQVDAGGEGGVQYETLIVTLRENIPQTEAGFQSMEKALKQLKSSIPVKGKGVVLFQ